MGFVKDILYKTSRKQMLNLFKKQPIFPYYHLIRDEKVAHIEHLYPYKNRKQFIDDLDFLQANYKALPPADIWGDKTLENTFLITFDDGLQEVYSQIFPILKSRNLKAIFFLNPNFVDNKEGLYKHWISIIISHLRDKNYDQKSLKTIAEICNFTYNTTDEFKRSFLNIKFADRDTVIEVLKFLNINSEEYLAAHRMYVTKEEIREMIDAGFYFGGHTMSHPTLKQLTHDEQKKEIVDSIEWVKKTFNLNYSLFAFPFTDKSISKKLLLELFEYDPHIRIFGNAGIKRDFDDRIIQRFSLENPSKITYKQIVTENLYKVYNTFIGKYNIKRK